MSPGCILYKILCYQEWDGWTQTDRTDRQRHWWQYPFSQVWPRGNKVKKTFPDYINMCWIVIKCCIYKDHHFLVTFFSFLSFVYIPRPQGVSLGRSCYGRFPPIFWCYEGPLHLVIFDRTPIMRFSSLGGFLPLWSVFRMTHPIVSSSCLDYRICNLLCHSNFIYIFILKEIFWLAEQLSAGN